MGFVLEVRGQHSFDLVIDFLELSLFRFTFVLSGYGSTNIRLLIKLGIKRLIV